LSTHATATHCAGGGSAKEWTKTLDAALKLDFDTAIPGHGLVTTKQMRRSLDGAIAELQ
jgi:hypothetical protein